MKNRSKKILIVAVIAVACALVSGLIVSQPVLNRGVVIGMGVDKTEEGNCEVTIQIAVAGESSAPGAPNRYAVISGEAPTLIGAMEKISRTIAYKPAYFHCHILLLGEKLIQDGVKEVITELFAEDSVMDDVAILGVKGTAKETLERSVSVQGAAAIYLQQLNKINSTTGGHPTTTLKTFATEFETAGYTPFLPWVEAFPVPKAIGGADTGGDEQNYAFDCSKTVLFHEDGRGRVAEEAVTVAIGLTGQADGILLPIKTERGFLDVLVKKSIEWWHIEKSGQVTLYPLYFVKVIATDIKESPKDLEDDFVRKESAKYVENLVTDVFDRYAAEGLDPLSIEGKYHKKYGEKTSPKQLSFKIKAKVAVSDA